MTEIVARKAGSVMVLKTAKIKHSAVTCHATTTMVVIAAHPPKSAVKAMWTIVPETVTVALIAGSEIILKIVQIKTSVVISHAMTMMVETAWENVTVLISTKAAMSTF